MDFIHKNYTNQRVIESKMLHAGIPDQKDAMNMPRINPKNINVSNTGKYNI